MISFRIGISDQHAEPDGSVCCLNRVRGRQVLGKLNWVNARLPLPCSVAKLIARLPLARCWPNYRAVRLACSVAELSRDCRQTRRTLGDTDVRWQTQKVEVSRRALHLPSLGR